MRIAQVSTVGTPVGATGAGSIESLVFFLTEELTRRGHDVTVFCAAGSVSSGRIVETLPGTYGRSGAPGDWHVCEWINLSRAVARSQDFDVLHSHAYLCGLPLAPLARCATVHTLHIAADEDAAALWAQSPGACVTAISRYQWHAFESVQPAAVIPHGVDPAVHGFRAEPDDYACFLGRFMPAKGPLEAIAAARELGLRILLAGPRNEYYDQHVAPLVDGREVEYVGSITGHERDALLAGARVLLYPLQSPEPFGLVMIEALMAGTPVAAFAIGAVPEVVADGVTGGLVAPDGDLAEAARRALLCDRRTVRDRAEREFSLEQMADRYLELYAKVAA
jgi:glycosyltransferase involved in cell wall biosynthesis